MNGSTQTKLSVCLSVYGGNLCGDEPYASIGVDVQAAPATPVKELVRVDMDLVGDTAACFELLDSMFGLAHCAEKATA